MKKLALLIFPLSLFAQQPTPTSGAEKLAAFKKQQELISQSPYKSLDWRLVGPDIRSGRSTDVEGITGNPEIIYAAFATGGLWKTENGGSTWKPIFDKEATQSIGDIALAPSDKNILYVGTGRKYFLLLQLNPRCFLYHLQLPSGWPSIVPPDVLQRSPFHSCPCNE